MLFYAYFPRIGEACFYFPSGTSDDVQDNGLSRCLVNGNPLTKSALQAFLSVAVHVTLAVAQHICLNDRVSSTVQQFVYARWFQSLATEEDLESGLRVL